MFVVGTNEGGKTQNRVSRPLLSYAGPGGRRTAYDVILIIVLILDKTRTYIDDYLKHYLLSIYI